MLPRRSPAVTMETIGLPENPRLEAGESARVAARVEDLRRTIGGQAFDDFITKACFELDDLARRHEPWPPVLIERGVNAAMLFGFESLEAACRAIAEARDVNPGRAPQAARIAAAALNAWSKP